MNYTHTGIVPNIIIAGAPKCGTTSLFHYLSDHPMIHPSNVKETCFLIDQDYPLFNSEKNFFKDGLEGYSQFFSSCKDSGKFFLEATPDYLYQENPLIALKMFPHKPFVIILLRKPSARIYSLFNFAQNNMGVLDAKMTFTQFVNMIKKGELPKERKILRNAIEHSKYHIYIDKWFQHLGREKVNVFLFEDLKKDPGKFLQRIAGKIEIDQNFYTKYLFTAKNQTMNIKNQNLHKIKRILASFMPHDNQIRFLLKKLYGKINFKNSNQLKSEEDKETIFELDHYFKTFNRKLMNLTDINLNTWD